MPTPMQTDYQTVCSLSLGNRIEILEKGVLTAPPALVPSDVDLVLETSVDLLDWDPLLEYEADIPIITANRASVHSATAGFQLQVDGTIRVYTFTNGSLDDSVFSFVIYRP